MRIGAIEIIKYDEEVENGIDEAVNGNSGDEVNEVQDDRRMVRFAFVAAVSGDASTTLPGRWGTQLMSKARSRKAEVVMKWWCYRVQP